MLRLIENGLRLIYDESTDLLDFEKVQEDTILKLLKHHGYEVSNLRDTVETSTQNVREIYLKYFLKFWSITTYPIFSSFFQFFVFFSQFFPNLKQNH